MRPTVPGLIEALEFGDSLSTYVEFLHELAALRDEGLVSEEVRPVDGMAETRGR